jgi:hypothetical protein
MANLFNTGVQTTVDGTNAWDSGTDLRAMLVTSSYTYSAEDDYVDMGGSTGPVAGEVTNSGYSRQTLASVTTILDDANDEVQCDCANVTFGNMAAGDQPYAMVVYVYNVADTSAQVISYNALTSPPAPNGGSFQVTIDSEGVFEVKNV